MPARRDPIDRVVDLLVAVPVSAVVAVRRTVPAVGRLARRSIAPGSEIVDRPGVRSAETSDVGELIVGPIELDDVDEWDEVIDPIEDSAGADDPPAMVGSSTLPIDDYDHLAARQVVDRLDALSDDELQVIESYERSHRHRQTVLRKIEQLTS